MLKQVFIFCAVVCALTAGMSRAYATAVTVDFAAAMDATGLDSDSQDGNANPALDPNGMLDSAEMALVSAILANASLDLSGSGGVDHTSVHNAWTQALSSATTDLSGALGIYPQIGTVAAGYAMLGPDSFAAINAFTTGYTFPLTSTYALALALDGFLGPDGDADGDGYTNIEEYDAYFPGGGTSGYVAAALDPNVGLTVAVVSTSGQGSYLVNSSVTLSVTLINTIGDETFQWQANYGSGYMNLSNGGGISGVATDTLTINPADFSDSATYRVVITNSETTINSPIIPLNIVATLPALNVVGLGAALILLALVAGWTLRRRMAA